MNEALYLRMDREVMDSLNEAFFDSMGKGYSQGYEDQKALEDKAYEKYAGAAQKALDGAKGMADMIQQKTGLSPALTLSLVAAGITGGTSALPMAALMYFARKYYVQGLSKVVSKGVDTAADLVQHLRNIKNKKAPQLQPEWADITFREWLSFQEAEQGWGDWLGQKIGYGAGRVAGAVSGLVGNVVGTIKRRLGELKDYITSNPRQAAKIALTLGLAAATGGVVGKLSKDLVHAVGEKVQALMPQQASDVVQAQAAISPESVADTAQAKAGAMDAAADTAQAKVATAADMKSGGATLMNKDMHSFRQQMHMPAGNTNPQDLVKVFADKGDMTPHELLMQKIRMARMARGEDVDAISGSQMKDLANALGAKKSSIDAAQRFANPTPVQADFSAHPDPLVRQAMGEYEAGQTSLRASMDAAKRFAK
jgi:hypothetical protein